MFYENLKVFNKQKGIFMNCVDIYSRYAWSIPLNNKTANACKKALEIILKDGIPEHIQCDKGSEFKGIFKKFCTEKGIELSYVYPGDKNKQGIVERFNKTLRDKIDRFLVSANTNSFIDHLSASFSDRQNW